MQINVKTNEDFKSCIDCIHSDDSVEICKLRECVHAVEVKECYEPKMKLNGTPLKTGHWIPVSERLPEEGQRILVSQTTEYGYRIEITEQGRFGFLLGIVDAWMPLPKPYGPQESEE